MTVRTWSAEGGTNQASILPGDTGSGDAFTLSNGAVRKYESTLTPIKGAMSGHIVANGVAANMGWDDVFSLGPLSFRIYYKHLADTNANGASHCTLRTGVGQVGALTMNTGGLLAVNDTARQSSSAFGVPVDGSGIRRVECFFVPGVDISSGFIGYKVFDTDDTTALWTYENSSRNLGILPITRFRMGLNGSTGSADYLIDAVYATDEVADYLGPYTPTTYVTFSESMGMVDSGYQSYIEYNETIDDSVGFLDTLLKASVFNTVFTESIGTVDPLNQSYVRQVIDSLDMLDTVNTSMTIRIVLNDLIRLSDNIPGFGTFNGIARGTMNIFNELIAQGFTQGTLLDRERARLLAKTGAPSIGNSLQDLYRIAGERPRF